MNSYEYNNLNGIFVFLGGVIILILILSIAVGILQTVALWKIYKKAGKGGWESIIPFYSNWVLVEISGLNWWWFLFFFAPYVSAILGMAWLGWIAYLLFVFNCNYNLAKKFNKDVGFAICLMFFSPICIPILGFSKNCIYNSNARINPNGIFGTNKENMNDNQNNQYQNNNYDDVQDAAEIRFCGNCGTRLNSDVRFCPNCGKEKK